MLSIQRLKSIYRVCKRLNTSAAAAADGGGGEPFTFHWNTCTHAPHMPNSRKLLRFALDAILLRSFFSWQKMPFLCLPTLVLLLGWEPLFLLLATQIHRKKTIDAKCGYVMKTGIFVLLSLSLSPFSFLCSQFYCQKDFFCVYVCHIARVRVTAHAHRTLTAIILKTSQVLKFRSFWIN